MSISEEVEFNHLLNEFFGVGSRIYQYCVHYKVKFHRKLRAKLKETEEYVDEKGDTVKLSEDDIVEVMAFQSFRNFMQNEHGPKKTCPIDITEFSDRFYVIMRVLRTCTEYGDTHPIAYLLLEYLLEYCTALSSS